MTAPRTPRTSPPVIVANANATLRCTSVRLDDKGHTVALDQAILAWIIKSDDAAPVPITPGGVPDGKAWANYVHDTTQGTWTAWDGVVYRDWKQLIAPLVTKWEAEHKGEAKSPAPALTTPSIGGLASGDDPWGIGQSPQPWRPGSR